MTTNKKPVIRYIFLSMLLLTVLFVIIIAFIITVLLYPNNYKGLITQQFEANFNYTLQLDGDIKLSLYPLLGVEINKITIKNPHGFKDPILLYADKIAFNIDLQSSRSNGLDTVQLHNAQLNLQRNSDGKNNWDNFASPSQDSLEQEQENRYSGIGSFVFGKVDIRNTSFSWTDETAATSYKVDNINIAIDTMADERPTNIAISANINSSKPAIKADLKMQGSALYNASTATYIIGPITASTTLQGKNIPNGKTEFTLNADALFNQNNDSLAINNFTFNALGTRIAAKLNVEHATSDKPKIISNINIEGKNLLTILQVLEAKELLANLRLQDKSFNLHTNLNYAADNIVLSNLKAKFADTTLSGQFNMQKLYADAILTQGELKLNGTNLPLLLQFASKLKTDIPQLQIYAQKLATIKQKEFAVELKFDADLATQKIAVPIFMVQAFGIRADGHLNSQEQGKNQNIDGRLSILGEKISPLLYALEMDPVAKSLKNIAITLDITGKQNAFKLKPKIQAKITNKNTVDQLTLNADIAIDGDKQTALANNIHLSGLGLNLAANIKAKDIKDDMTFTGNMEFTEFNLRQLMQKLQLPVTKNKKSLAKVALETEFSGTKDMFALNNFALSLDDTKINAQASLANFDQPEINSAITIDKLNIDHYLPAKDTQTKIKDETTEDSSQFDALQTLKSKNTLKIDTLIVKNLQLKNVDIGLEIDNGLVTLDPIDADLYQGTHKGSSIFDTRNNTILLQANTQLSNVQMQPLISDYTQSKISKIQGLSNLSARISTKAKDVTQLKNHLQGVANLNATEVVLDLPALQNVAQTLSKIFNKKILHITSDAITKEQKMTASFNIKDGVIKNDDLFIDSIGLTINGGIDGKHTLANLRDNSINYDFNINISTDIKLPIRCQGTIDAISAACKPDYASIGKVGIIKKVESLIGDKAGQLLDKISPLKKEQEAEKTEDPDPLQKIKEKALDKVLDRLF